MNTQRADGPIPHEPRLEPVTFVRMHNGRQYRTQERRRVACPCGFDKEYTTKRGAAIGRSRHGLLPAYLPGVYVPTTTLTPERAMEKVLAVLGEATGVLAMLSNPGARAVLEDTLLWAPVPDLLSDIRDQATALLADVAAGEPTGEEHRAHLQLDQSR